LNEIKISVFGKQEVYKILEVIEFNSDRKRMSVVLKNPDGKVVVYTKGADSMLWDLMKKTDFKHSTDETLRVEKRLF
jgi:phospholipid-translocating ATPase